MVDRGSQVRPLLFSASELVIELARAASSQYCRRWQFRWWRSVQERFFTWRCGSFVGEPMLTHRSATLGGPFLVSEGPHSFAAVNRFLQASIFGVANSACSNYQIGSMPWGTRRLLLYGNLASPYIQMLLEAVLLAGDCCGLRHLLDDIVND